MKITCQACQAKYTIADEKVAGKTVKIKCKKCGAAIVVHGGELAVQPAPAVDTHAPRPATGADDDEGETRVFKGSGESQAGAPAADEWTVNVSDDEQRPMTTAQIVEEFRKGVVTGDSYVWKDGMADWLPLSSVPELAALTRQSAPAPGPFAGVTSPLAAAASPAPAAARRQGGRSAGVDLFGAAAKEEPPPVAPAPMAADRLVGERNENSVLFSLAALTAAETAAKVQKKDDIGFGGKNNGRGGFDDIMNLGGGGLGGGGPILAPPPLLAPVVEAPPPPAPVAPVGQMSPGFIMPIQPPKRSNAGVVIGVLAGMAIMGVVGFFAFGTPAPAPPLTPDPTPTATQATTATTAPVVTTQPTSTSPADTATASTTDKPADKPDKPDKPAAVVGGPGPVARPVDKPTDKPTDKPADKPTAEAPADKPADKPAAPAEGGGREFSKAAASAALGAAAAAAKGCKKSDGPTGTAKVSVTFAPSGNVTSATVQGPPFAGTSVGGCIAGAFRSAKVPPFDGSPVRTSKSVTIN